MNLRAVGPSPSTNADEFYAELVSRNHHFIPPATQDALRRLKVVVAGCGSGGGACIEPLARAGVEQFWLADNGDYELPNFNRQRAFVADIGRNKAEYQQDLVLRLNPHATVRHENQGVNSANVEAMVAWSDLILDGVDVTTRSGIEAKVRLHETAQRLGKPVFSFLDLGFCQWGVSYDYRKPGLRPMNGRASAVLNAKNPIKALFLMFPLSGVPYHSMSLVLDALEARPVPISQLGIACDLLSALVVASTIRLCEDGHLAQGWYGDVTYQAWSPRKRFTTWIQSWSTRAKIKRMLRRID